MSGIELSKCEGCGLMTECYSVVILGGYVRQLCFACAMNAFDVKSVIYLADNPIRYLKRHSRSRYLFMTDPEEGHGR